jgi:DNA repair exonuclease SbcCD ATPase subunit
MATIFKKIKWKNFLSTGDEFTNIEFQKNPITLITGANGSGKSTLIDAIAFVLFGKPHRNINKPQLVNSVNASDCVVEIEFTAESKKYKIIRGIKPSIFEIYENGKLLNQEAKTKDYQSYLETNILKFNYKSFHQIVVLGSSSFVPFMQLAVAQRREIIENLLDINIFTKMNILLKDKLSITKENIRNIQYQIDLNGEKQQLKRHHLNELETIAKNKQLKTTEEINSIELEIDKLIKQKKSINDRIANEKQSLTKNIKSIEKVLKQLNKYQIQIEGKIETSKKTKLFFDDNNICPTCSQTIDDKIKKTHIHKCTTNIEKLSVGYNKLEKEIKDKSNELQTLNLKIDDVLKEFNSVMSIDNTINSNQSKIKKLNKLLTEENKTDDIIVSIKSLSKELTKLKEDLSHFNKEHIKLKYDFAEYQLIGDLLKDSGIKSKIIRQYIPLINKYINHYLEVLEFFVTFEFDEFFNERILSRHRDDFTYASFSEGEKSRIDLALLFAWREIARKKNSVTTNLLILDEVMDGSLDTEGLDNLQTILGLSRNETNAFIISHKKELISSEKFDAKIEFVKNGNFSEMI